MAHSAVEAIPGNKPPTLKKYLSLAARALFPRNNDWRMSKVLGLLLQRQSSGRTQGWITRRELEPHWHHTGSPIDAEAHRRRSNAITNGMVELERYLIRLNWAAPNFRLSLESQPAKRAQLYRLRIERRGDAWNFTGEEAPHSEASHFIYAFKGMPQVSLAAQLWGAQGEHPRLEVEALRESVHAQWRPPSHLKSYRKVRNDFFEKQSAAAVQMGQHKLHDGELWGIKEVGRRQADGSTTVTITTTRIQYEDYLFVREHYSKPITIFQKDRTVREWLGMDGAISDRFCPPRDALCVSVALVTPGKDPVIYLGEQRTNNGSTRWELSAAGAASSTQMVHEEKKPDLPLQAQTVTLRETGLRFKSDNIQWLGFARSLKAGDSAVIALVELNSTPAQVQRIFGRRHEVADLIRLKPVRLSEIARWLEKTPNAHRGDLLEVGLALVAAKYGYAQLL